MIEVEEIYDNFVNDFSQKIYNLKSFSDYIFLCVGSDKIIGDAFGPIVGENLQKLFRNTYNNIRIIGTLEKPVSGTNLNEEVKRIYETYKNPCIIAIDAALSKQDDVGKIIVTNTKMKFGRGINKKMLEIGDISIKGIIAKDSKTPRYNFGVLQNTSLNIVMKLANITSKGIYDVIKYK